MLLEALPFSTRHGGGTMTIVSDLPVSVGDEMREDNWHHHLGAGGSVGLDAQRQLHELLLKATRLQVWRLRHQLPGRGRPTSTIWLSRPPTMRTWRCCARSTRSKGAAGSAPGCTSSESCTPASQSDGRRGDTMRSHCQRPCRSSIRSTPRPASPKAVPATGSSGGDRLGTDVTSAAGRHRTAHR